MRKRVSDEDRKIGKRINARRVALGLTQSDLAEVIGVTFQQIQKVTSGVNRISAVNLTKLASRLGVPVSYFLGESEGESDAGMAFLSTKDGAAIVAAMAKITDARLRRTIADLVVRLADTTSLAAHPPIIRNIEGVTEGLAFNDD